MIKKELLDILACPKTRQPLAEAEPELVARINAAIERGAMKNVGGEDVSEPIEGGLVREDGMLVYPLREGIPVLLSEEGLPVPD